MQATLFGSRVSPFVEKVARALQLKGIPFSLVSPKSPGDFKRWNPQTRKMPRPPPVRAGRRQLGASFQRVVHGAGGWPFFFLGPAGLRRPGFLRPANHPEERPDPAGRSFDRAAAKAGGFFFF